MWDVLPLPEEPRQEAARCVSSGLGVPWLAGAVSTKEAHLPSYTGLLEPFGKELLGQFVGS